MPCVSIVAPGDGEQVLSGATQMLIVEDGRQTEHRLAVGVITIAQHTEGPPPHWHAEHDEGFYVISGGPRFTIGGTSHDATAGTFVMVPRGAPHTFANPGEETAVILNTFTPDLYVQYFRDLRDMVTSGRRPTPDTVVEVMARYHTYPTDQPVPTRCG